MDFQNLRLEVEDSIGLLTVERPQVLNALDLRTLDELEAMLEKVAADPALRVLIVTGAGEKAFVAGADIKELASLSALQARGHAARGQRVFARLEGLGKPSIAAINGFALGGGLELALACTFRLASSQARLGLPEITLGLIPGFAGTQRLPRVVGQGRALQMILTGRPVKAEEALAMGLVSEVCPPDELLARARALAAQLAGFSGATLALAEETVRRGAEMAFDEATAFEAAQFGVACATEDAREGMTAFLEKRKPRFQGR